MITKEQYFGIKPHTPEQEALAIDMLMRANALVGEAAAGGGSFTRAVDPDTGTEISGSRGGAGDGGFRLPTSITGRGKSSHKEARAVDVYDPHEELDTWLDQFETGNGGNSKLEEYGLYREAPGSTHGWCHLTTRAPGSGRRTFQP